ncbi:MAG: NAD(P)H-dependent flavin oxidoreductase [Sphingomonas sp.]
MVGWGDRRLIELVGTEHPIIQAPMAGAGDADLCIAAMRGGALGSLPCGMLSPREVRDQVAKIRSRTSAPFALNFFCHSMPRDVDDSSWRALLEPYYLEFDVEPGNGGAMRLPFDAEMCGVVEALRPPVVTFHFGLPEQSLLQRVKAMGSIVIGNATDVEEACWLAERGLDAIVVQGFEAGGHRGHFLGSEPDAALGLFALIPLVAAAVSVPLIAAGGVSGGRGIAAALALGASGVQLGTAYLHSPEATISAAHRERLREGETRFTNLFTGGLARGLSGRLMNDLGPVREEAPPYPLASGALAPIRAAAEKKNDYGFSPMWAGQAAPTGEALPAAELTRKLAADALAIIEREA